MKNLFATIGLCILGATLLGAYERPNILMIAVDDLRPELNSYGQSHMVTPHLDQLSEESILFSKAYTQQAVCLPARISLFSGQFPQTTGVTSLREKYWEIHDNPLTLMRHLRNNGYHAVAMGKILHDEQWHEWDDWTEMMNQSEVFRSRYASPESEKKLEKLAKEAKEMGLRGKKRRQYVRLGPTEQDFGARRTLPRLCHDGSCYQQARGVEGNG